MDVEVQVGGHGVVTGDEAQDAPTTEARCDLCAGGSDAVASLSATGAGAPYACRDCLRERLEAISVARWRFRTSSGLPWGKITS